MDKDVKVSIFFGGGVLQGLSPSNVSGCPLQGDPLDDIIARTNAEAEDKGYSAHELKERINAETYNAKIEITKDSITLDGYPLENLNPSVIAFYILVCNHSEGLVVGKFNDKYLDEYKRIYGEVKRKRKEKEDKGITFDLDNRSKRYRDDLNKAIKQIEQNHPGLNLSRCKIFGTERWKIQTSEVFNLMGINSHIEF